MKIEVTGSGSAYSKSRNTSAILVEDNTQNQWLIDCGPTVPRALWQRGTDINDIQVIFFTHIHPDHCAGLPALLNQWKSFGRQRPLDIFCQKAQQPPLESLVQLATWPKTSCCFEIRWHEITDQFRWQHWQLFTANSQHEVANKALRIEVDGQSLFYSGDGRPTSATKALMQGVDLAFQECASAQTLPAESSHGDLDGCIRLLSETGAGALGLYHCFDEALAELEAGIQAHERLFLSKDGLVIDLSVIDFSNPASVKMLIDGPRSDGGMPEY